jgi:hypothetical protein
MRRLLPWTLSLLAGLSGILFAVGGPEPRGEEPAAASRMFRPPQRPAVPEVKGGDWVVNPIDAFVLAKLEANGLRPSARADKLRLLRRVTVDLTGLPPTLEEQDAFLADTAPEAYAKVVERLLASPRYGERWAQHWLDLVRYAETDGFKADDLRPEAYRYRDYVIRALNADLPYDRFVRQQLAGDELEPDNPEAVIATGFNRLHPDEYNAANLEQRHQEILDDVTDVTGLVFLGLTIGCARCHDHKYDPTLQSDYYRLQSFFAATRPRDDVPIVEPAVRRQYEARLAAWQEASYPVRQQIDALLADRRKELRKNALSKFRPEIQQAAETDPTQRTPYQEQIALLAEKQVQQALKGATAKLPEDKKKLYEELLRQLEAVEPKRPEPPPMAMSVSDTGREAPSTHRLIGGDWRKPRENVKPGFPAFLGAAAVQTELPPERESTGRRAALARWLTCKDHPLTARVLVNRLWQHHFGVGIVATASDFGAQGDPPTHLELLDWLAVEFVENGWGLKHMHRLMVTSAAYCQDSQVSPDDANHAKALKEDPGNQLLWHARRRRLEGEALRDAMLAVSGELNLRMFGVSARPKLPEKVSNYAWKPDAKAEDQNRRSVYVFVKRNMRYPLFDAFDLPDLHSSCGRRATTTTAPQALLLLNGEIALERAQRLASDLLSRATDDEAVVRRAYRLAWARTPTAEEVRLGVKFLAAQAEVIRKRASSAGKDGEPDAVRAAAVADFCHALLNTNEFLYVD